MTEAVLLVGGLGTRLRPLTLDVAKPMLPTAGVPFLAHQIARLSAAGVERVVLATSYRAETFVDELGDGSDYGVALDYVTEEEPLGTGGAIRNAAGHLTSTEDAPVVILNGDILSGHDIAAEVEAHRTAGADVTLHLVEVADPRPFGCVPVDAAGRVTAFLEKSPEPVTNLINAGCYVFRRGLLDAIPAGRVVSVERDTFPRLLADGALVRGYVEPEGYWLDLGTPQAYLRASCDLVLGRVASAALPGETGEWLALDGADVAPDALLRGGTMLGAGTVVGAGSVIEGSVLLDGARVGEGVVLRSCVLGADAEVGDGCVLEEVVVGARARVGLGNQVRGGVRIWTDVTVPPRACRFATED